MHILYLLTILGNMEGRNKMLTFKKVFLKNLPIVRVHESKMVNGSFENGDDDSLRSMRRAEKCEWFTHDLISAGTHIMAVSAAHSFGANAVICWAHDYTRGTHIGRLPDRFFGWFAASLGFCRMVLLTMMMSIENPLKTKKNRKIIFCGFLYSNVRKWIYKTNMAKQKFLREWTFGDDVPMTDA